MKTYFLGCRPDWEQTGLGANRIECKQDWVQIGFVVVVI